MSNDGGTPKTLDEAIMLALCVGPLSEIRERSYRVIKDFLAQRFGAAYLRASHDPKMLSELEELYESIIRRSA